MKFTPVTTDKQLAKLKFKQGRRMADPVYAEIVEGAKGNTAGILVDLEDRKIGTVKTALIKAARALGINIQIMTTEDETKLVVKKLAGKPKPPKKRTTLRRTNSAPAVEPDEDEDEDEDTEDDEDSDEEDDEDEDEDEDEDDE